MQVKGIFETYSGGKQLWLLLCFLLVGTLLSACFSAGIDFVGGLFAGSGLDKSVYCISVAHDTIVTPSSMQATMGVPTMQPLVLSSCSGFCQCANAHVAIDSEYSIMERVDAYLNSGFYIE